ncbi:MAG: hypothetical protein Kow00124_28040 [Anaerolineae bacterium]
MSLRCQIITQERTIFDEDVDIVLAPAIQGRVGILKQHAPLITALDFGELIIRQGSREEAFAIGGGVLQVANDHVIVLAESAENVEDIDVARAEDARRRAEQIMAESPPQDPAELAALEAAIRRANLRVRVGRRQRKPRRSMGSGGMEFDSGGE